MKGFIIYFGLICLLFGGALMSSCSKDESPAEIDDKKDPVVIPPPTDWSDLSNKSQDALTTQFWSSQKYYNQDNNGHTGFNYWWNAHALDVLIDAYNRTKDPKYLGRMKDLLEGVNAKNGNTMKNTFYDDMEWMALACLRAYDATNEVSYKNTAKQLWEWIKVGWSPVNNGGIAWASGSPNSKNACSNGPAAILAARFYQLDKDPVDLEWTLKIYNWMKTYLVNSNGLVWDGYGNTNEDMVLTYNQGTYMGAALELYKITRNNSYRADAIRIASYLTTDNIKFSPNGILKGENTGDGGLFKGIFIRYFTQLIINGDLEAEVKKSYLNYLVKNGESLLKATRKPEIIFGNDWKTLPSTRICDASVHLSGTMLFECLDELKRLELLK